MRIEIIKRITTLGTEGPRNMNGSYIGLTTGARNVSPLTGDPNLRNFDNNRKINEPTSRKIVGKKTKVLEAALKEASLEELFTKEAARRPISKKMSRKIQADKRAKAAEKLKAAPADNRPLAPSVDNRKGSWTPQQKQPMADNRKDKWSPQVTQQAVDNSGVKKTFENKTNVPNQHITTDADLQKQYAQRSAEKKPAQTEKTTQSGEGQEAQPGEQQTLLDAIKGVSDQFKSRGAIDDKISALKENPLDLAKQVHGEGKVPIVTQIAHNPYLDLAGNVLGAFNPQLGGIVNSVKGISGFLSNAIMPRDKMIQAARYKLENQNATGANHSAVEAGRSQAQDMPGGGSDSLTNVLKSPASDVLENAKNYFMDFLNPAKKPTATPKGGATTNYSTGTNNYTDGSSSMTGGGLY